MDSIEVGKKMSRTIELGRAVLSSQSAGLELWLYTLITVSSFQGAIDLQQLGDNEIIALLLSGTVWVERGSGMHLSLAITVHREPLASDQLRQLADSIVNAPAWKQLNLQPSLPVEQRMKHGKLHINVGQCPWDAILPARRPPHLYTNAPATDASPPEGVPTLLLQSVHSTMAIAEIKSRAIATRSKRPKPRRGGTPDLPEHAAVSDHEDGEVPEILFHEVSEITDEPRVEAEPIAAQLPLAPLQSRERQRSATVPDRSRQTKSSLELVPRAKRKRPSTISTVPAATAETPVLTELEQIEPMIDAAMRISVFNNLRGTLYSLRIKANTFTEGLADVAPALWRPGYRSALFQSAYLAPTLSSSLDRASSRAKSGVLRTKFAALTGTLLNDAEVQPYSSPTNRLKVKSVSPSLSARLWIRTQKTLLFKPFSGTIRPFCVSNPQSLYRGNVNEILEENLGQIVGNTVCFAQDDLLAVGSFSSEVYALSTSRHEKLLGEHITERAQTMRDCVEEEYENNNEPLFASALVMQDEPAIRSDLLLPVDPWSSPLSESITPEVCPRESDMEYIRCAATDHSDDHIFDDEILFGSGCPHHDLALSEHGWSCIPKEYGSELEKRTVEDDTKVEDNTKGDYYVSCAS